MISRDTGGFRSLKKGAITKREVERSDTSGLNIGEGVT